MQELLLQRLAEEQQDFGYTQFFLYLKNGFDAIFYAVNAVLNKWEFLGFILAPFVVFCIIALIRKIKG